MAVRILLAFLLCTGTALAQSYPDKPVRLLLTFAAGGGADILARSVTEKMRPTFGQPIIVESRPGAGGNLAMEATAKAAPDGYTLVFGTPAVAINGALYKKLNYDPLKDLVPLGLAAVGVGSGAHLAAVLFTLAAGVGMQHVPYKGIQQIAPDMPALAEALPGFEAAGWYGFFTTAGTPRPVLEKLNLEIARAVKELAEKIESMALVPAPQTLDEAARFVAAEAAKWTRAVRASGASAD